MACIQLDLFSGEIVNTATTPIAETENADSSLQQDICARGVNKYTTLTDPCKGCPLRDLCGADDCGMKLYDIDVPTPETQDFEDWLSEPLPAVWMD